MVGSVLGAISDALKLCYTLYTKIELVKRYKADCQQLQLVQQTDQFLEVARQAANTAAPGWTSCLEAVTETLQEIDVIMDDCRRYGAIRSILEADDIPMRMQTAKQNLQLALQLVPVNQGLMVQQQMDGLQAQLQRLLHMETASSRQNASNHQQTHDSLAQILALLPNDPRFAAGHDHMQLQMADLQEALVEARKANDKQDEQHLQLAIQHIQLLELQSAAAHAHDTVPADFKCPITLDVFTDPVMLIESGETYERSAITEWLACGHTTDPLTNVKLSCTELRTNRAVKRSVQTWHQQQQQQQVCNQLGGASSASHNTSTQSQSTPLSGPEAVGALRQQLEAASLHAAPPAAAPATAGTSSAPTASPDASPVCKSRDAVPAARSDQQSQAEGGLKLTYKLGRCARALVRDKSLKVETATKQLGNSSTDVQLAGAKALSKLPADVILADAFAVPALVNALSSASEAVKQHAAMVFSSLADHCRRISTLPEFAEELIAASAVWLLVQLLATPAAQKHAAKALASLSSICHDGESRHVGAVTTGVVDAGGVPAVLQLLRSADTEVQMWALTILGNLTPDNGNAADLVPAEGLQPIIKLTGSKDSHIQLAAMSALRNVTGSNTEHMVEEMPLALCHF